MRLAGTSDSGWVVVDLTAVARAIAVVRASSARRTREAQPTRRPSLPAGS
jgi:hypothetical protein